MHGDCLMKLIPPKRRHAVDGAVYCFREYYEPSVLAAVLCFVDDGSIAWDVGANIGLWTLLMSRRAGGRGHVVAFEPIPTTAARLRENLGLSDAESVTVIQAALGSEAGTATMYVPYDAGQASMAAGSAEDVTYEVPISTLDEFWAAEGKPSVGFVKMDAEGSEPRILNGGSQFFRCSLPNVVCEVNSGKLAPMGHDASQIYEFFRGLGYQALAFDQESKSWETPKRDVDGDIVFVAPGHSDCS